MILGDIRRVSTANTDAILFNIDSKADTNYGRDAILRVFLKVFNEMQGFCADHPEIAYMERHLQKKGKLADFQEAYRRHANGLDWLQERDAYHFNRDQVVASLSEVLGQSQESAARFVDGGADGFSITPENFSKWVKEYLDEKGRHLEIDSPGTGMSSWVPGWKPEDTVNDAATFLRLRGITTPILVVGYSWGSTMKVGLL